MQVLDRGSVPALPGTWIGRNVRVEYVGAEEMPRETGAVLLDTCGIGLVLGIAGARTIVTWPALRLLELVEE
jgi:hypothetical protein